MRIFPQRTKEKLFNFHGTVNTTVKVLKAMHVQSPEGAMFKDLRPSVSKI